MKPERWQQVEQLYQSALKQEPSQRAAFLEEGCAGDESLRHEVESLLAYQRQAEPFLEAPLLQLVPERLDKGPSPSRIGQQIGSYKVQSQLGAGGMGEVYLAQDSRLGRRVALKLLPAQFTQEKDRVRRLEREARAASALNHPNIVTIYEVGQIQGITYIATEYVEGQTLRQRLAGKPMQVGELLDLSVQVAAALAAAHQAGIVHRDIKPENVMVRPDGYVKVLDFGLAKLTEPEGTSVNHQASAATTVTTGPGAVMGTVHYMSPEQALGEEVDHRTDLFSLGVVMYELATAKRPFNGSNTTAIIDAILHQGPPSPLQFEPTLPPELGRIITKALEKDRQKRYQNASELGADLKQVQRNTDSAGVPAVVTPALSRQKWGLRQGILAIGLLLVLGLATAIYSIWEGKKGRQSITGPGVRSLAVLPFKSIGPEGSDEFLGLGMADALITKLSSLDQVIVRPTSTVRKYNKEQDPVGAGRELRVEAVLEGSIQRAGDRIRTTVQLIGTKEGSPLWAGKFEETASDLFAVQDSISEAVARSLVSRLSGEDKQKINRRYTENTEAYSLYVKGRYFLDKLTREGFQKARDYFQHAIKEDPAYALAYVGLADSYFLSDLFPPEIAMAKAKAAAMKALEIDESLAEAHSTLAGIKIFYEWDLQGAEAEIKRGMELRPNYAWAHLLSARYWQAKGRLDQAITEILRAQALDPLSIKFHYVGGEIFFCAGQNERAVEQFQTAVEIDPDFQAAHEGLALAYEQQGSYDRAASEWQKSLALSGNKELADALGQAYAQSGYEAAKKMALRKLLGQLRERSKREYVPSGEFAILHSRLGEKDQALDWLERAFEERDWIVFQLGMDPLFDSFHSDPRFIALLKKLNTAKREGQAHKPDSV